MALTAAIINFFNSLCCTSGSDGSGGACGGGAAPQLEPGDPYASNIDVSGNISNKHLIVAGTAPFVFTKGPGWPAWLDIIISGNFITFYNIAAQPGAGVYPIPFIISNGCGSEDHSAEVFTINEAPAECIAPDVDEFGDADEVIDPFEAHTGNILFRKRNSQFPYINISITDGDAPFAVVPGPEFAGLPWVTALVITGSVLTIQLDRNNIPAPGEFPVTFSITNACGSWDYNGNIKIIP